MKKTILILTSITVGAFIVAALLFVLSGNKAFNSEKLIIKDVSEEKVYKIDNLNIIDIDISSTDIKIVPIDGDEIKINLNGKVQVNSEKSIPELDTEIDNDTLTIKLKQVMGIGIFYYKGEVDLEIGIPKEYKNDLDIKVSSADVTINNLKVNKFNFKSSSGNLDLEQFETDESILKVSSGKINALNFSGDLQVKLTSGKVNVEYKKLNNNVTMECTSGDIELKLPENSEFNLKANTSSGDITTDFPISLIGTINNKSLEGTVGNSDNNIEIKTISGDINIAH